MPHVKSSIKTVIINFTIFTSLFLTQSNTIHAQNLVYKELFDTGIDINHWEKKNYTSEEEGSFSPLGHLDVILADHQVEFSGWGKDEFAFPVYLNNTLVYNIGKSLIYKQPIELNDTTYIQTDVTIVNGTLNYGTFVIIEFNSDNRIAIGLTSSGVGKTIKLLFEENDSLRCPINDDPDRCRSVQYEFDNYETITLGLEFRKNDNNKVLASVNNEYFAWGSFQGETGPAYVGIASTIAGNEHFVAARFDNFKVSDFGNGNIVPNIKQYENPWGTEEYDHAESWDPAPSDTTISRWGCALTSAAMIMQYHGFDVDPEELNNWLKDEDDGYTRYGGVMWPAVSRYTRENDPENNLPTLEFSYHNPSEQYIEDELNAERPPILKFLNNDTGGTHFIVATEKTVDNFNINDPDSSTNSTLSDAEDQWGDMVRVGRFFPTNSDLSYLVLYVDDGFDLRIYNPDGSLVLEGDLFTENPVVSNDGELLGEPLKAFYLPQPDSGKYTVEVFGPGQFTLDSYIYDNLGNAIVEQTVGSSTELLPITYIISYNENGNENGNINKLTPTHETILKELETLDEAGEIRSHGVYTSIQRLISNSKKNSEKGNILSSKTLLNVAKARITTATSKFIDQEYSEFLTKQLDYLLDNI
jgi:hypothetical protein